jgi:hypothetical protein
LEEAAKLSFRRLVRRPSGSGSGVDAHRFGELAVPIDQFHH